MPRGLFQDFVDVYIRLSTLAVEPSVVIMTAGSQLRSSQIKSYGRQFSIPVLLNLCSESVWAKNFEILV